MQLKSGTLLQGGKYRIVRSLGQGGFGITYEAEQVLLRRKVAIKEFFMKDYCERDEGSSLVSIPTENSRDLVISYKQKFVKEAQMIASLRNPHIVSIHEIFEENETAYYVMEFLTNGSLEDVVKENGPISESDAMSYITQIAEALSYIHNRNILHLDVKPSNILLNNDGNLVLIDFGISKHYDESGSQTSTTPIGISKGYAPLEQYQQGSVTRFSPATDIYSLGATLFFLLTGKTPPEAAEVYEDGLPELGRGISDAVKNAIIQAMSPRRKNRPQCIKDFVSLFTGIENGKCTESHEALPSTHYDESTIVMSSNKTDNKEVVRDKKKPADKNPKNMSRLKSKILWCATIVFTVAAITFAIIWVISSREHTLFRPQNTVSTSKEPERINAKTILFSNTGGTERLLLGKEFPADIVFKGKPSWCLLNYLRSSVSIYCLSNDTGKERDAVITLCDKSDFVLFTITIKQEGGKINNNHEGQYYDSGSGLWLPLSVKDKQRL